MKMLLTMLTVLALAAVAGAATFQVTQSGTSFSPNDLTINTGDTVEWVWTGGFHTVTNGTGAADPNAGTMFDATLSGGNFSYTFTTAGDVPYFCRPHETFGMTGIIRVSDQVANESATFSAVKSLFR